MRIEFDHAQPRIARDRIGIALTMPALAGDVSTRVGTWINPATDCLELIPSQAEPDYYTSSAGRYGKLGLSDFGSPAGWTPSDVTGSGNLVLFTKPDGGTLSTTTVWPKNTPFAVHFHAYATTTGEERIICEGAWSLTAGVADDTAFRITTAGTVQIYRAGELVGEGRVSVQANALNTVLFIPCRGRELAIVGMAGGAFRVVFADLADDNADPVITPAAAFHIRGYGSTAILATPVRYPSSGTALSLPISLGEPPATDDERETFESASWIGGTSEVRIYGSSANRGADDAFGSVVSLGGGSFTPNGVTRDVRVRTTLSGDDYSSPHLYGAIAGWRGTIAETPAQGEDGGGIDVSAFLVGGLTITVPDGGPATFAMTLKTQRTVPPIAEGEEPTVELLSDVVDRPDTTVNRPVGIRLTDDGPIVFDGTTGVPDFTETSNPEADRITIECADLEAELQAYTLAESLVFDGTKACHSTDPNAARYVLRRVLPTSRLRLGDFDAKFGEVPPEDTSEFSALGEANESGDDVLERIVKDALGLCVRGMAPTDTLPVYEITSPEEQLGRTPFCTLYGTVAEAKAAEYPDDGTRGVYRNFRRRTAPSEANVVNVVGWDPRTRRPLRTVKRDDDARDPTLAPEDRPDNWTGHIQRYGIASNGLIGQEAVDEAAGLMFDRLVPVREIVEFECDLPIDENGVPLWRGNRITLDGKGTYVVASLRIELRMDERDSPEGERRRIYRAQIVATDRPAGTRGVTGDEIADAAWRDSRRGGIVRRRSGHLTSSTAYAVVALP